MKKVDKDPFSNGTEEMMFESSNCDYCIKNSVWIETENRYTNADKDNMPNKCSILRDIIFRMVTGNPISQRTIDVCKNFTLRGVLCPYLKTRRAKGVKKQPKEQLSLEL